ncbi:MAG: prolipoprotein diacylglyceryl transferase [Deltaproteobacteria bacterium]|jgi:phosphatidylglycerol:prolipoprotein diacylglycerol transferase|nr:prolipoprotein diacylglyceryl transferase [Deltaproteobacteria bacterium]
MLTYPQIDPVIFSIGPLAVRWYGLTYMAGFLATWILGNYRAGRPERFQSPFNRAQFDDIMIWGIIGLILGARLGYVLFYKPLFYLEYPKEILAVWHGGMSFHGGLLGVLLALWLAGRKRKVDFLRALDFFAPLVPPGLFFGRIGNFINAELWGRHTDAAWGMVFPVPEAGPFPRHPSQLYEAFLEGLLLFAVLWVFSSRPRGRGAVCGLGLLGYGLLRLFAEFFREPDRHLGFIFGGVATMGMLLCLPMILMGALLLWRGRASTIPCPR